MLSVILGGNGWWKNHVPPKYNYRPRGSNERKEGR